MGEDAEPIRMLVRAEGARAELGVVSGWGADARPKYEQLYGQLYGQPGSAGAARPEPAVPVAGGKPPGASDPLLVNI